MKQLVNIQNDRNYRCINGRLYEIISTAEAAEYLGIKIQTLQRNHLWGRRGYFDIMIAGKRFYAKEQLRKRKTAINKRHAKNDTSNR